MLALFNRFEIEMTKKEAESVSHQGQCDSDVEELLKSRKIQRQLEKIGAEKIAQELKEYGAWDEEELKDTEKNKMRIVWIAGSNITEEMKY